MILFRADANGIIGMGHVMRCLSIADAFDALNQRCVFVISKSTSGDIIKKRGYDVVVLDSDYFEMDSELDTLVCILQNKCPEIVFVDSYCVSNAYLSKLKEFAFSVYIDDIASFAYPVNCLINYNIYGLEIDYRGLYEDFVIPPHFLLGTGYVPLRSEYIKVEEHKVQEPVKDILISTGGSDQIHLALDLIHCIAQRNDEINYHIIVGALNNDFDEIMRLSSDISNIVIHHNVKNMSELISSCDIAVSASGSTMYEICRCGVPMVIYSLADNQLFGNESFSKNGLAISCGDLRNCPNPSEQIFDAVQQYIDNYKLRIDISRKMQLMVNGQGANRIAEEVLNYYLEDTRR